MAPIKSKPKQVTKRLLAVLPPRARDVVMCRFGLGEKAEGSTSPRPSPQRGEGDDKMVEKKAYLHIGPKFGTVSKQAVTGGIHS